MNYTLTRSSLVFASTMDLCSHSLIRHKGELLCTSGTEAPLAFSREFQGRRDNSLTSHAEKRCLPLDEPPRLVSIPSRLMYPPFVHELEFLENMPPQLYEPTVSGCIEKGWDEHACRVEP